MTEEEKNKKIEELKDEWIKEYSKIQPNENKNLLDGIGFKKTIELEKKYKKLIKYRGIMDKMYNDE